MATDNMPPASAAREAEQAVSAALGVQTGRDAVRNQAIQIARYAAALADGPKVNPYDQFMAALDAYALAVAAQAEAKGRQALIAYFLASSREGRRDEEDTRYGQPQPTGESLTHATTTEKGSSNGHV